ncbi:hypothetical protein GJAV_G00083390 [Gymnothorax javanicus]|nr:hypothetical protein GJAV_G00083390 [Gymnothorax javanicus]
MAAIACDRSFRAAHPDGLRVRSREETTRGQRMRWKTEHSRFYAVSKSNTHSSPFLERFPNRHAQQSPLTDLSATSAERRQWLDGRIKRLRSYDFFCHLANSLWFVAAPTPG